MPPAPPPDRFAYLPFGVGARVCIGAHFALVEATLALARMIGAFRVELVDKEPVMPVGVVTTQPDRSPMFPHHAPVTQDVRLDAPARSASKSSAMSDIQAQFSVLKQTADPAVADAIAQPDRERRGPRAQPHQCAGFFEAAPGSTKSG